MSKQFDAAFDTFRTFTHATPEAKVAFDAAFAAASYISDFGALGCAAQKLIHDESWEIWDYMVDAAANREVELEMARDDD